MSKIHEKSPKHCAEKQAIAKSQKSKKKLFFYLSTFFLSTLSLLLLLLLWLFLRPRNPHFSLTHATIDQLTATSKPPFFLNSSITLSLLSTNPNKNVGIHHDGFLVHASYSRHVITPDTPLPPFYQHRRETNLLAASLVGNRQPVGKTLAHQVRLDRVTGKLTLDFKVTGWLRWKIGNWISRRYRFDVDCATVLPLGGEAPTKEGTVCSTSI